MVANVPGGNGKAVAEATVALMLGAIWRTPVAHDFVKSNQFERRWELHFEQLTDRVLGLVGLGNIGARVAHICGAGFDMKVLGYDPFVDRDAHGRGSASRRSTILRCFVAQPPTSSPCICR